MSVLGDLDENHQLQLGPGGDIECHRLIVKETARRVVKCPLSAIPPEQAVPIPERV